MSNNYLGYMLMCQQHGYYIARSPSLITCPHCLPEQLMTHEPPMVALDADEQTMLNHALFRSAKRKEPIMTNPDAEAATSFRYRLRQAAKLALEIGDKLLQLSQDASEPNAAQLKELRDIESSLDVTFRYRVRDVGSNNYRDSAGSA